jgi:hypothetical protein
MANTINIPRTHLIMALCLPLAVLLGYFLAEPMDSASLAIVVVVLMLLAVPLLMKWHHPMLVLSWNAIIAPAFLPGQPSVWMIMALAGLLFAMLNRSVQRNHQFIFIPSLAKPLLFLGGVVLVTAMLNGGIGFRTFGAARYGARGYFYIFAAIAGFFAFTSNRIPAEKVGLYLAMFFLPALTGIIPNLTYSAGPSFYFLFNIFPIGSVMEQMMGEGTFGQSIVRYNGLSMASPCLYCYLLASYGIRGVLDTSKPWRTFLFLLAVFGCLASGFRSVFILFALTFGFLFYYEGLHRTRLLPALLGVTLAGTAIMLPFTEKLPLVIQRTLSFLPANVDPIVKRAASDSTNWRIDMWKMVLPEVPKYLFKGKGYNLDPNEMFMAQEAALRHEPGSYGATIMAGDYHNGPLSIIIPLGLFGVLGFGWFLTASLRYLYRNYRFGDPRLKTANTFLLAAFVGKVVFFLLVFGSFYSDLFLFTGLMGFSVSLNGEPEAQLDEQVAPEEAIEAFS